MNIHHNISKRPASQLTSDIVNTVVQPRITDLLNLTTYKDIRMNLVKSIIYNNLAFSCVDYFIVRHCFELIGKDSPSRNTVKQDIIDCAALVQNYVKRLLEPISLQFRI